MNHKKELLRGLWVCMHAWMQVGFYDALEHHAEAQKLVKTPIDL